MNPRPRTVPRAKCAAPFAAKPQEPRRDADCSSARQPAAFRATSWRAEKRGTARSRRSVPESAAGQRRRRTDGHLVIVAPLLDRLNHHGHMGGCTRPPSDTQPADSPVSNRIVQRLRWVAQFWCPQVAQIRCPARPASSRCVGDLDVEHAQMCGPDPHHCCPLPPRGYHDGGLTPRKLKFTKICDIRCKLLIHKWDGWPSNCRAKPLFEKVFRVAACADAPRTALFYGGCYRTWLDELCRAPACLFGQRDRSGRARSVQKFERRDRRMPKPAAR